MINIAICDDEKYILDKIKKLVFDFFHRKNVEITVSQFGSGEELLRHNKNICLLYTSPSPRDKRQSRMPSSA